jgi:hypothetical protein
MSEATFVNEAGVVELTAPSDLAPGLVVQLPDGRAGIVSGCDTVLTGDVAAIQVAGFVEVACATGTTFSKNDTAYLDYSARVAIASQTGESDFYLGRVARAKVSGELTVLVELNVDDFLRGRLRAVSLDHADATEHVVLAAANNVSGMQVLKLTGTVTEAMVGSSQDQLIVGLFDEDDNELGRITATDGAADTVGTVLSDETVKPIPAGKGAYVKVIQATAGGSPAGAITIQAFGLPL